MNAVSLIVINLAAIVMIVAFVIVLNMRRSVKLMQLMRQGLHLMHLIGVMRLMHLIGVMRLMHLIGVMHLIGMRHRHSLCLNSSREWECARKQTHYPIKQFHFI
jgi:hypothetical protein